MERKFAQNLHLARSEKASDVCSVECDTRNRECGMNINAGAVECVRVHVIMAPLAVEYGASYRTGRWARPPMPRLSALISTE